MKKRRISFRLRMVLVFGAFFSALLIVFSGLLTSYNMQKFEVQSDDYSSQIVKTNISLLDRYLLQVQTISEIIANDADVLEAVNYRADHKEIDYAIELYNQRKVLDKLKRFDILTTVSNVLIVDQIGQPIYFRLKSPVREYQFEGEHWFLQTPERGGHLTYFTGEHSTDYLLDPDQAMTVSAVTPILRGQYKKQEIGYLICDLDMAMLLSGDQRSEYIQMAVYSGDQMLYFPIGSGLSETDAKVVRQQIQSGNTNFRFQAQSQVPYLVSAKKSEISDWMVIGLMPLQAIGQVRKTIARSTIIFIGLACLITALLAWLIARKLTAPISQLVSKYNRIEQGDFSVRFEPIGISELDILSQTSQSMVKSISQLTQDLIEEEKKIAEEQLKVLQHQINPHFLNNVLQSIKALAVCGKLPEISKITTLLGKVLSYSVYNPYDMVDIGAELEHVQNYVAIENIRYNGMIDYKVIAPEELPTTKVPKLMLQPIVENAIRHGYVTDHPLHLVCQLRVSGACLEWMICDDGGGMAKRKAEELNTQLEKAAAPTAEQSIGLLNVNQRLKKSFGSQYGLHISQNSVAGITVTVVLPIILDEGQDQKAGEEESEE